ncbi:MAG: copper chaperone PCu(A)C, partial [Candidatus Krumholzibacteriales bacterium]
MSFKTRMLGAVSAAVLSLSALPAFADGIEVHDAYARASSMMSSSGAAFMVIHNDGGSDDHLVDARSDVADKVELHTHREDENGVMRMIHV